MDWVSRQAVLLLHLGLNCGGFGLTQIGELSFVLVQVA
jgi:hypothetical protein